MREPSRRTSPYKREQLNMNYLRKLKQQQYHLDKSDSAARHVLPLAVVTLAGFFVYIIAKPMGADIVAWYALMAEIAAVTIQLIFRGTSMYHFSKSEKLAKQIIALHDGDKAEIS